MILIFALASLGLAPPVFGQTDVNDVHVAPRTWKMPKTEEVAPRKHASRSSLNTHVRPLKVDVDLVLVPVTITDPMNRLVTGLEKENFQLFEGGSRQEIKIIFQRGCSGFAGSDFRFQRQHGQQDGPGQGRGDGVFQDRESAG